MTDRKGLRNAAVLALLFALSFLCIVNIPIYDLDEIYKYYWARSAALGFVPYKDFNVVTTPLYLSLFSVILRIAEELIVFRIMEAIGWAFFGLALFLLLSDQLGSVAAFCFGAFSVLILLTRYYVFDYNTLAILFILYCLVVQGMRMEVQRKHFLTGLLCALCGLSKQTVGAVFTACMVLSILFIGTDTAKKLRGFLAGFVVPNAVFLIWLLAAHTFFAFLDQALFGLGSFTENRRSFIYDCIRDGNWRGVLYAAVPVILLACYIVNLIVKRRKEDLCYIAATAGVVSIAIPICDVTHYNYFVAFTMLLIFKMTGDLFRENRAVIRVGMLLVLLSYIVVCCALVTSERIGCVTSDMNGLRYLPAREELWQSIRFTEDVINGRYADRRVRLFTHTAVYHAVVNDQCNGFYDIFFKGNLGTKKPTDFIDDVIREDAVIMIKKDYDKENRQNPGEIVPYIREHMELLEVCGDYELYAARSSP